MPRPTVVTIGNFDGAHLGHAALVRRARDLAGPRGRVIALAFDPHPMTTLRPALAPPRLTEFSDRSVALQALGVDEVERLEPTTELLNLTPEAFIEQIVGRYQPAWLVEGPDFHFGKGRAGTVETLQTLGTRHDFSVAVVDPVTIDLLDQSVVTVSSTMVRWLLAHSRVADAARLLGRPYSVRGEVRKGDQRGRTVGIPTVNVEPEAMPPADGVFAGRATDPDGRAFPAAINVGFKPTFGGRRRLVEAHLIGYDGPVDHYGWTSRIEFLAYLRGEMRFPNATAVVAQIRRDIARVRDFAGLAG
ncbi:MAG: bifunctional riboflavin kinase/FMN adenylyltransferase [Phycisphaerales bacterium]